MRRTFVLFVAMALAAGVVFAQAAADSASSEPGQAWTRYNERAEAGAYPESLQEARRAYDLASEQLADDDPRLIAAMINYGKNLLWAFRFEESRPLLQSSLQKLEGMHGANSPETLAALIPLAELSGRTRRADRHARYLRRARAIVGANFEEGSIGMADQRFALGEAAASYSADDAALNDLNAAYAVYLRELGPAAFEVGRTAIALARLHAERREYALAESKVDEALRIFDPDDPATRRYHLSARTTAASMLESRGLRDQATEHCVAVGKLLESEPGRLPLAIIRQAPNYPVGALSAGITGNVTLEYTVDADGFVRDPKILDVVGSDEFRDAAIEALMKFRFAPQVRDGVPVAQHNVSHTITFDIVE